MLKHQEVLDHIDEDDTDVFAPNLLDKYVNPADNPDFEQMCYTDFVSTYILAQKQP